MPSMEFTEGAEQQLIWTTIPYELSRQLFVVNDRVQVSADSLSLKDLPWTDSPKTSLGQKPPDALFKDLMKQESVGFPQYCPLSLLTEGEKHPKAALCRVMWQQLSDIVFDPAVPPPSAILPTKDTWRTASTLLFRRTAQMGSKQHGLWEGRRNV